MVKKTEKALKAVDFFCSGGGVSCGMQQAGVEILAGIDFDINCQQTYESNIKGAKFIHKDIFNYPEADLSQDIDIARCDDDLIFIGCSPCQYWSVMRTNKQKSSVSKNLLHEFSRFVEYYRPGYVVVENVPGIVSKKNESNLDSFLRLLERIGYKAEFKIVSLKDYGIPQARKRFTLVANRLENEIVFPSKIKKHKTVRDAIGDYKQFPKIEAGHTDKTEFKHSAAGLKAVNVQRLNMTPMDGGSRESWAHTELQLETYKRNDVGFKDTYGRMFWDRPAPTITTKFFSISNGRFAHPEQNRAISLREGAVLQTFPLWYKFKTNSIAETARIIGNAVPPLYARKVAEKIIKNH